MDFVHNGDVDLQHFSIFPMYRSDWEVIEHPAFEIKLQGINIDIWVTNLLRLGSKVLERDYKGV